jgi:hypothetical protein
MAMVQTVTGHTVIGNGGAWTDPNGIPPARIATACHFATVFWLFWDEFHRPPNQAEVLKMGNAQLLVTSMIAHGNRKDSPLVGSLNLTPGAVLVFVDQGGIARHSCVAIAAQQVGGYNQAGWWSAGGADHAYSTHTTNQLLWGHLGNRNKVHKFRDEQQWYQLYEVPEAYAKMIVRGAAQG